MGLAISPLAPAIFHSIWAYEALQAIRAQAFPLQCASSWTLFMRLLGPSALVSFERARLLEQLGPDGATVTALDAQFVHYVALEAELTSEQQDILSSLLNYGAPASHTNAANFVVIPRPGTLSPWSSKATDIARSCGLGAVQRIERGVAWSVTGLEDAALRRLKAFI